MIHDFTWFSQSSETNPETLLLDVSTSAWMIQGTTNDLIVKINTAFRNRLIELEALEMNEENFGKNNFLKLHDARTKGGKYYKYMLERNPSNDSTYYETDFGLVKLEVKRMAKKVNKGGRPTEKTADTIQKLEQAFMHGATVLAACHIAQISPSSYYDWLKTDDEFSNKMKIAQEYPDKVARMNLVKALEREQKSGGKIVETSKWWAERRLKGEFSTRSEHTGKDGEPIQGNTIIFKDFKQDEAESK